MNKVQQTRFDSLYQRHVNALTRQGKSTSTIEAYSRAVRRIAAFFDRCPDRLSREDLEAYFSSLIKTLSWSTIKLDRNGLLFFYTHVLKQQWQWVDIIKPPVVKSLPDILTQTELAHLLQSTREPRYHTYFFIVYSMGLRFSVVVKFSLWPDCESERHLLGQNSSFDSCPGRTNILVYLEGCEPTIQFLALRGRYVDLGVVSDHTVPKRLSENDAFGDCN